MEELLAITRMATDSGNKIHFPQSMGGPKYAFCLLEGIMVYLQVYLLSGKDITVYSL